MPMIVRKEKCCPNGYDTTEKEEGNFMRPIAILLLLCLLAACAGCAQDGAGQTPGVGEPTANAALQDGMGEPTAALSAPTQDGTGQTPGAAEPSANAPTQDGAGESASVPAHIADDSYTNVRFDAAVDIPPAIEAPQVYRMQGLPVGPDGVVAAFAPYFPVTYEQVGTSDNGDASVYYLYGAPEGATLWPLNAGSGSFSYETKMGEVYRLLSDSDGYTAGADLPALPRAEAARMAQAFVEALGLGGMAGEMEVGALARGELLAALDQAAAGDPEMEQIVAGDGGRDAIQDAYLIFVPLQIGGLPLHRYDFYSLKENSGSPGSGVTLIVTADGLEHVQVDGVAPGEALAAPAEAILPLEAAMERLNASFDIVLLSEPVAVDSIGLCYLPLGDEIVPAYTFVCDQGGAGPLYVYFNAFTGEQIAGQVID